MAQLGSVPLRGETALVTGARRAIGRAMAEALATAGASVTVMARSRDQVEDAAATIASDSGQALPVVGDVTCSADVQRAVSETERQFGSAVTLLMSNAGITGPY